MNLFSGAELERFVDSDFPQWNESLITTGFEFDIKRLGNIEGIIEPPSLVGSGYNLILIPFISITFISRA